MRVLVVEDEKKLVESLKKGLAEHAYAVDAAYNGEDGLLLAGMNPYDVIILDISLPKMDGFEVVRNIRKKQIKTPVLFLTARQEVEDRVKGLDLGADDYLCKPFAFSELLARIRAIKRRRREAAESNLSVEDLILDPLSRKVTRGGRAVELRPKEFAILQYLMENQGRVMTRTMIMENIWDYSFASASNVIDVHLKRLREKINEGQEQKLIRTIKGAGYTLD